MKTHSFIIAPRWLATILLALAFQSVQAQMSEGGIRFGLKVGINGANLYDDAKAEDRSSRIGFIGGPFVKIPIRKFAIRPELLFAMKGGNYDFFNNQQLSIKLGYVEMPISLEYALLGFINLHAGIQGSYLVNTGGTVQDNQGNGINFNFNKEDFEKLDYGWHAGAGLDFGNIGLHLRVSRGLREVSGATVLNDFLGTLKNSAWAITLSAAL
jgi:hypothetical protein